MDARALSAAVTAALLLAGCNAKKDEAAAPAAEPAAPAVDLAAEEQAIRTRSGEWMNYMNAKDAASIGNIYVADAVNVYDGSVQKGSPAILAGLERMFAGNPDAVISWTSDSVRVAESGDMAAEIGTLHLDLDGAAGKKPATDGAFVTVWVKVDGAWRVLADAGTDAAKPSD